MRWLLWTALALVLLWAALPVWPLVGFYRIGSAIEAQNAQALAERVDFRALRRSLTQQIIAEYLRLTGKDVKLGRLKTGIATGVGTALADPIVAPFLTPEALLEFLGKGRGPQNVKVSAEAVPFSSTSWRKGWQIWWQSEFWGKDFYVYLPPEKPKSEQFRVRMNLKDWKWKLAGIELPEPLRVRLAQELVKQQEESDRP